MIKPRLPPLRTVVHVVGATSCGDNEIGLDTTAMTLRLTPEEAEQLRRYAARHGRSMQDVAHEAVVTLTAGPPADRTISTFDFGEPIVHRTHELLADDFSERNSPRADL